MSEPTAFRDAARRVLEARLPADDPKWGPWIEGTLDELDTLPGVVLDHREAQTALGWYADAWGDEIAPALYDKALARKLGGAS